MKHKYNPRKIKSRRSYTTEELASVLNTHIQTIRQWRKDGLKTIDPKVKPYLFDGNDIRLFLQEKNNKHKVKLLEGEFYCLSCRKAVKPETFEEIDRKIIIGNNRASIVYKAQCPNCAKQINRFSSKAISEVNVIEKVATEKPLNDSLNKEVKQTSLFDIFDT